MLAHLITRFHSCMLSPNVAWVHPAFSPCIPLSWPQTVSSRLWNLDRLDQRELPLDGAYTYGTGGRLLQDAGPQGRVPCCRCCLSCMLQSAKMVGGMQHCSQQQFHAAPSPSEADQSAGTGKGVTIYVVDSGIKPNHQEFKAADGSGRSRASYGEAGWAQLCCGWAWGGGTGAFGSGLRGQRRWALLSCCRKPCGRSILLCHAASAPLFDSRPSRLRLC